MTDEQAIKVLMDGEWWDRYTTYLVITDGDKENDEIDDELFDAIDAAVGALMERQHSDAAVKDKDVLEVLRFLRSGAADKAMTGEPKRAENDVRLLTKAIELVSSHPENQENPPLTMEELECMDGQPVWVECPNGNPVFMINPSDHGRWALVDKGDRRITLSHGGDVDWECLEGKLYRYPPKKTP